MRISKIKNPVILHGPGRSGTTLTYKILARHEDFFWISNYVNNYNNPYFGILSNLKRNELFDQLTRNRRKFPEPSEAYGFWRRRYKNYYEKDDAPLNGESTNVLNALNTLKGLSMGKRFITKFTGRPRDFIFDEIFDNPSILWIERDPVSVIASYYKNKWFYKKQAEVWESLTHDELLKEYIDYYVKITKAGKVLEKYNYLSVSYENLIANRVEYFEEILQFLGLKRTERFERTLKDWEIFNSANRGYEKYLSNKDVNFIRERVQHECI